MAHDIPIHPTDLLTSRTRERAHEHAAGPLTEAWSRSYLMAIVVATLFVVIFVIRLSVYIPNDGISALFCLPVALTALRFGPWLGMASALIAVGLFAAWATTNTNVHVSAITLVSRTVIFGTIGGGIGWFAAARERMVAVRDAQQLHIEQLLDTVSTVREQERATVSSELHDFVLQQLLVSLMHIERARTNDGSTGEALSELDRQVRDAITSLRRIIDGIQPIDVEHMTTSVLLDQATAWVERDFGLRIECACSGLPEIGPSELRMLVFRLVSEALRNAAKHANASSISLTARITDIGTILVRVRDDGRGLTRPLDVRDQLTTSFGTGFNLLVDRFLTWGGHTTIRSVPGGGTTIELDIPTQ